ncbi:MAG: SLOG family protein [Rikenellaceae bacterium]
MKITKSETVAFTGYRLSKILRRNGDLETIEEDCCRAINELIAEGYDTFLTGMSDGFDMIAAMQVLRAKESNSGIHLIAVIPFVGQEIQFSEIDKERYQYIKDVADDIIVLADRYVNDRQYLQRNDFLLANSTACICYYDTKDRQRGGTKYTYNRAVDNDMILINLFK